ncbi:MULTISPECIES: DUF2189 domain-containing protein [Silvimonas]|uniref:DUF2189 domain-containing protein n=1 Tax=Silvimonas TaxID=300264 RepID=UPI0024B37C6D|nr:MULTISPECIES: DUF2189 domain-containing protein [Silvimonas]MDR3429607.1 DUF2189 domain-containing protein [Silvimonas sp.]
MDLHLHGLDDHFSMPETGKVGALRSFYWLKQGWIDFKAHPLPSLGYGVVIALIGFLVMKIAANYAYLSSTAITGFLLLAPLGAAGIYELTKEREEGRETSFAQSIRDLLRNVGQIAFMGVILGFIAMCWERISAILFALFYGGEAVGMQFFTHALTSEYLGFTIAWSLTGLVLACVVFAIAAVSIPMLADREVDSITALVTSVRVVAENIPAMLVWAAIIVVLTAIGFATYLVGLVVIFPLLGHATWCAYRDLVH